MANATTPSDELKIAAATLYGHANVQRSRVEARAADLDQLIHNAQAREHRRAAFNQRDKACYRIDGAFEPTGGLHLDPVTLAGFLSLGSTALLLLVQHAIEQPDLSIVDMIGQLFRSPAGRLIRDRGVWVRWTWLRDLYVAETVAFLASKKGRDPKVKWRTEKPTVNQQYIAAEICLDLQLAPRGFASRGEAHDWIKSKGGNPRFLLEPHRPELSALAELLR